MAGPRRFLFERLAGIDADDFDVRRAIADQVRRLVATIPLDDPDAALAEGPHLFNLGLPAVVDLGLATPDERLLYAEHLQALIARFEPRLADTEVAFTGALGGPKPLGIAIQARLAAGTEEDIIRFRVDADGLKEA